MRCSFLACPEGDEVERSFTSGDVKGWPGRPQREMYEIYAGRIRLSNTAKTLPKRASAIVFRFADNELTPQHEGSVLLRYQGAEHSQRNRLMLLRRENMLAENHIRVRQQRLEVLDNRPLFGGRFHGVTAAHRYIERTNDRVTQPAGFPKERL